MSSNLGHIMTLANSIIGVGILAMPYCFLKCGVLLSVLLLLLSNLITRLSCFYLLKSSIKTRRKTFELLGSYIFGSSGKLMIELCSIGFLLGSCITYFVVIGDLGPQILSKIFGFNQTESLRTIVMIIVTVLCIIPLCLLRNIESLSFMCISSIIFYFCLVIKIIFEADHKLLASEWYEEVYWWRPSGVTQCLPIFSMALACQMQLFEIYESLPSQTIDKMNEVVKFGTGICTSVYVLVGFFGYVAFSTQPFSGNILLSFTPSFASDVIKVGFVMSVAVSFPLVIFPCRASLYSLLYHRSHAESAHYIPEHRFKYITISMVLVALVIGILIPSIELVIGLVGSTIGIAICIMFPAACFVKTNKKNSTERLLAQFLMVFGVAVMLLGTIANLDAIDNQQPNTELKSMDTVVLPPEPKPLSSSEKAVVDPPNDNPFPTDTRPARNKLIHPKATFPLVEPNADEVVAKDEAIKPPLPEPQPESKPESKPMQSAGADLPPVKSNEVAPNVEPSKNEEIVVERVAPPKTGDIADQISRDAIAKEDAEMADEKEKPKEAKEPGLMEMVDLAKQIKDNQESIMDEMTKIQEKMAKMSNVQQVNAPNANAENSNGPNTNAVNSNVEKPNVPNQAADAAASVQEAANVHSANLTNEEKSSGDAEKSRNVPNLAVPIPRLLASGDTKAQQNPAAKQPLDESPVKEVVEEKEKPPAVDADNNVGGRDLLSEKSQNVEADQIHNL